MTTQSLTSTQSLAVIIATAFNTFDKAQTRALNLANLDVLVNAVLYNPAAALHLMENSGAGRCRIFLTKWFGAINGESGLPRVHDKKLSIMALCALLEMDPSAVPEPVKDGWHNFVVAGLQIFKGLPHAMEGD